MKYEFKTKYEWKETNIGTSATGTAPPIPVATPPIFKGPKGFWSPEDLLLSSVETCLFLSFLFQMKKSSLQLISYNSEAEGVVEQVDGALRFTSIQIRPRLKVSGSKDEANRLLEAAHESCLVSRSLDTPVVVEAVIESA